MLVSGFDVETDEEFNVAFESVDLIKVEAEPDDGVHVVFDGAEIRVLQKTFQVENIP